MAQVVEYLQIPILKEKNLKSENIGLGEYNVQE
jgi:hypothetical protein